ncbi:MAG: zinc metallopeptidase [Clostridia bacterium]|nr:zinc metallopeptidase [Clostridia bacterium]
MGFFYGYFEYLLWMLPAIIISLIAQSKVSSAYSKYSKVINRMGITGAEAARKVLSAGGVTNVQIASVGGKLTDHFDPRSNTIRLSDGVYGQTTVAAIAIAAHEAGHALQHAEGYLPNKIRSVLVPISNIGSRIGWILILIGFAFSGVSYYYYSTPTTYDSPIGDALITIGIILYSTSLLFTLITLPVEFNASKRALKIIESTGMVQGEELVGAKKTLTAAAMTYVAAALTALLQLLRIILIAKRRR